ncbi:sigma-54-dependent Fis family transcriptional regulator [candidate division WOR-3 bacterium]|nr:sigma-54-dependent Fis family transcriptional regulator [candidate division WOR-3 bacterium]
MLLKDKSLLVIDDDEIFSSTLSDLFSGRGMRVFTAETGGKGLEICSKEAVDVVVLDQKLPDVEGYKICEKILGYNDKAKIIFSTAFPSFDNAVKAIEVGAFWYLSKPFNLEELILVVERSLKHIDLERGIEDLRYLKQKEEDDLVFAGSSEVKTKIEELADFAAKSDSPVLITGETGTGKTLLAKTIHKKSRKKGPFVSVNCSALPESLVEAELFGYKKGAFTGAEGDKKGLFEVADQGTLLLDEIGEMPLTLQSKLLGVLEEKKFRRLGDVVMRKTDARIIAATNSDIDANQEVNLFRKDLYYRLNVIRIEIPPLRERRQDIRDLALYFLNSIDGGKELKIPESEIQILMAYGWNGNAREMRNIIERAVILATGDEIFPSKMLLLGIEKKFGIPEMSRQKTVKLIDVETEHIKSVLEENRGNLAKTARDLGISLSTLKRKLRGYKCQ